MTELNLCVLGLAVRFLAVSKRNCELRDGFCFFLCHNITCLYSDRLRKTTRENW